MLRFCTTLCLLSLFQLVATAPVHAQVPSASERLTLAPVTSGALIAVDGHEPSSLPSPTLRSPDHGDQASKFFAADPVGGQVPPETVIEEVCIADDLGESCLEEVEQDVEDDKDADIMFGDWLGYNATESDMTWLTGSGDNLGIFSLESYPTLETGQDAALMIGTGFHFLNGPIATDLPPRLFDFQLAYQSRRQMSERLMVDYRFGVGAFSDFEGSARQGIRFPGHVVSYYEWRPWLVTVLGAEALDRDDISVLPVAGWVWRPKDNVVYELVFPRPKIHFRTGSSNSMYLSGELGGGTWAIERDTATNDNVTYRDLRLLLGFIDFDDHNAALELGWAFARKLQYRSGFGDYRPDDTFVLRFRSHF